MISVVEVRKITTVRRYAMSTGHKKRKDDNAQNAGPGSNPGDFRKMSGMMGMCCDPERFPDCLAMMKRMADVRTDQPCCEPAAEKKNE
jgi:hypothetical protein